MATIFGDVIDLQQHPPYNLPHPFEKIKGFPLKAKSSQNTATYQKLGVGVPIPSPLYYGGGMNFAGTSED